MRSETLINHRELEAVRSARDLRVALFSGNYNYARDGANKALNKLVGHLLDEGAQVRVYSPTGRAPAFEPTGDLVSVPSVPFPFRPEYRIALGLPAATKRDIAAFGPNIVHLSAPDWMGMAALRYARELGLPVVASFHTRFEAYFEYYGLGWLRRWAWERQRRFYLGADRVLAPNPPIEAHLRQMGISPGNIRPWARGVETDIFSPRRRDESWRLNHGFASSDVMLLFFGRLVREKGIECFVETVWELRRRGRDVRPLIVGDGPARKDMERAVGSAIFAGHLDGPELGSVLASADILLNPSMTEAFGNVNLEAMASGLAVVSADAPSARALITEGKDGLLRSPGPKIMADTVADLMDDSSERARLAKAAVAEAAQWGWVEVLDDVIEAYCELRAIDLHLGQGADASCQSPG